MRKPYANDLPLDNCLIENSFLKQAESSVWQNCRNVREAASANSLRGKATGCGALAAPVAPAPQEGGNSKIASLRDSRGTARQNRRGIRVTDGRSAPPIQQTQRMENKTLGDG